MGLRIPRAKGRALTLPGSLFRAGFLVPFYNIIILYGNTANFAYFLGFARSYSGQFWQRKGRNA